GIADDFLTTTAMACVAPLIIAPAMNCNMFNSVAFQHNLQVLTERGAKAIFGSSGYLACGDIGAGRMAEPNEIVDFVAKILTPNNDYNGKRVLITCGATSEKLDDVRVITNFSSGKTGMALAERVITRGGSVTLILGNHTAPAVKGAEVVEVTTTEDMYNATLSRVSSHDIFIMSAAPADYRPLVISPTKIKGDSVTINLVKNRDIAEAVGANKGNKIMVAFSAETDNLIDNAKSKLINKHADFIVANDITRAGAGFGIDTNIISIVDKDSVVSYDIMSKIEVADIILDKVLKI
ncbi:MAG: bifunctional phosphopantothenoylcysteine decarboxylase/phosphopantothenate--cysteine ligase CoaBC, partial [Clostridia bacterium]